MFGLLVLTEVVVPWGISATLHGAAGTVDYNPDNGRASNCR
jgi:hypothetical protein